MDSRSSVVESDPLCGLTQSASPRSFAAVAARECATAHSRTWGPTTTTTTQQQQPQQHHEQRQQQQNNKKTRS